MQPGTMTPALEEATQVESLGDDPVERAFALAMALSFDVSRLPGFEEQAREVAVSINVAREHYDRLNWWGVAGCLLALALGYVAGQW
jgi:hypothetical protein